jgi:hypothetical protein
MEIARLRDISHARELDNKAYENRIKTMEQDIDQNDGRIQQLAQIQAQKEEDLQKTSKSISNV